MSSESFCTIPQKLITCEAVKNCASEGSKFWCKVSEYSLVKLYEIFTAVLVACDLSQNNSLGNVSQFIFTLLFLIVRIFVVVKDFFID